MDNIFGNLSNRWFFLDDHLFYIFGIILSINNHPTKKVNIWLSIENDISNRYSKIFSMNNYI